MLRVSILWKAASLKYGMSVEDIQGECTVDHSCNMILDTKVDGPLLWE